MPVALILGLLLSADPMTAQSTSRFGDGPGGLGGGSCEEGYEPDFFGFCVPVNPCPRPWGCFPIGGPNPVDEDDDDDPTPPALLNDHDDQERGRPPCENEGYNFRVYEIFADEHCPGWSALRPQNQSIPAKCRAGGPWAWIVSKAISLQTTYRDCLHKCFSDDPGYASVNGRCE